MSIACTTPTPLSTTPTSSQPVARIVFRTCAPFVLVRAGLREYTRASERASARPDARKRECRGAFASGLLPRAHLRPSVQVAARARVHGAGLLASVNAEAHSYVELLSSRTHIERQRGALLRCVRLRRVSARRAEPRGATRPR